MRAPNDVGGVNCYSAAEISGPWWWEGQVLMQKDIAVQGFHGPWIVERPKVLYNTLTDLFVMWFHLDIPSSWEPGAFLKTSGSENRSARNGLDKYIFQHAAVATARNASGPFQFLAAMRPDGQPSLDLNVYQDPMDGQAYLLRDVAHRYTGISKLTPDFLNTTGIISKIPTSEGMAMFRLPNGTYYVLSSHLSGWKPNPMIAWRSTSTLLDGADWEDLGNPTDNSTSFYSQPTSVLQYNPASGDPYFVYVGDNWVHCGGATAMDDATRLQEACYVWLPIKLDGATRPIEIRYQVEWDLENPFGRQLNETPALSQAPLLKPQKDYVTYFKQPFWHRRRNGEVELKPSSRRRKESPGQEEREWEELELRRQSRRRKARSDRDDPASESSGLRHRKRHHHD